MGFVVLPVGKLAEWFGIINPATISSDAATMFGITAMLIIWLVLGITIGSILSYVTIKKPEQKVSQLPVPEHL